MIVIKCRALQLTNKLTLLYLMIWMMLRADDNDHVDDDADHDGDGGDDEHDHET